MTTEALRANPDISVGFAVNNHSAIALIEAAEQEDREIRVFAVGGEDPDFIARVTEDGPLEAVASLFPEVVGVIGIEAAIDMIGSERPATDPIITPHSVVTAENFEEIYERCDADSETTRYRLRPEVAAAMVPPSRDPEAGLAEHRIAFVPHYPAHDWYRLMGKAMRDRAKHYGIEVEIAPPQEGIQGARSAMPIVSQEDTATGRWLRALLARAHPNVAVVALAAKMARIVWALLHHGRSFEAAR